MSSCPLSVGRDPVTCGLPRVQYGKSPAQLLIRWGLQCGFVVIPKTVNQERIEENRNVFDFTIASEDLDVMDGWNEDLVTGWDPTVWA